MLKLRPNWRERFFADEQPQHTVYLDGFWIYKREVTVAQYRKFCAETARKMPDLPRWADEHFPMVNVSWHDAAAYAAWAGGALPTEAQWEKAARGTDGRRYTWGSSWDAEKCNNYSDTAEIGGGFQANRAAAGGSYPASDSPYGAQDMAGNVWEWCQDCWHVTYEDAPLNGSAWQEENGGDCDLRVTRGGSYDFFRFSLRASMRYNYYPSQAQGHLGLRCVR